MVLLGECRQGKGNLRATPLWLGTFSNAMKPCDFFVTQGRVTVILPTAGVRIFYSPSSRATIVDMRRGGVRAPGGHAPSGPYFLARRAHLCYAA
jgi:hypothetical protein